MSGTLMDVLPGDIDYEARQKVEDAIVHLAEEAKLQNYQYSRSKVRQAADDMLKVWAAFVATTAHQTDDDTIFDELVERVEQRIRSRAWTGESEFGNKSKSRRL